MRRNLLTRNFWTDFRLWREARAIRLSPRAMPRGEDYEATRRRVLGRMRELLEDPVLSDVLHHEIESATDLWRKSVADDQAGRERAYYRVRAAQNLVETLSRRVVEEILLQERLRKIGGF